MARAGLLRFAALVALATVATVATGMIVCEPDEYLSEDHCCRFCPAGHFVSGLCSQNHSIGECEPCRPGTFMAYPSGEASCSPCSPCRPDQEVVANCALTSNTRCQCRPGHFYCDSEDCVENCFRCSSSAERRQEREAPLAASAGPGAPRTRSPAGRAHPPGTRSVPTPQQGGGPWACWPSRSCSSHSSFATAKAEGASPTGWSLGQPCWAAKGLAGLPSPVPGVLRSLARIFKRESSEPGGHALGPLEPTEALLSAETKGSELGPGREDVLLVMEEETSASAPRAGPCPAPTGPGGSPEPQAAAPGPGQAPRLDPGARNQTKAAASLEELEQEYAEQYVLTDTSGPGICRCYYHFACEVPGDRWNMLMRFVGLQENEIGNCEEENPRNVVEQRYRMLVLWRDRQGSRATVFRLMAALQKLQADMPLQNILNKLVADGILEKRHGGDTPPAAS
ncbi:tumor necrosis factor receptor superfamily member 25-like isoform X1 [Lepus europaeus]|uniref:tumor necrosis factor receptor superfamily member 25-like isoform X1 n=1 Tax=Lepus europaeus TaxID=9983 RepID=UPI002B4836B9|nr:tumor necrosis factor receptor superfamily member 25-like isoform X1 [Lepus europaeus]